MKRESLVTNTEKLLFDILGQQKKIEQILINLVVKSVEENSTVKKSNGKANEKVNENNKKVNVKKGAKSK